MAYFDGVKVGDTVYLWDKPVKVERVEGNLFQNYETGWFAKDGLYHYFEHLGQVLFWQPVTPPVPPPRPKRKVKKEGWINVYKGDTGPCAGVLRMTKEQSLNNKSDDCVATVKLEWEEEE